MFHCTSVWLVVWSGLLSGPLCTQLGWLCLLASLTHPTTPSTLPPFNSPSSPQPAVLLKCGTHDIVGCVQSVSQNQPVQPVTVNVSVMIAITLLYFWCKSYVATTKHIESYNTLNVLNLYFSKSRKVCTWRVFQN